MEEGPSAIYDDPLQVDVPYRYFIESHILPVPAKDGVKTTEFPWIKIRGLAIDEQGCLKRLEKLKALDKKKGFLFDYSFGLVGTWLPLSLPNEYRADKVVLDNSRSYDMKDDKDKERKAYDDDLMALLEKQIQSKNNEADSQRVFYEKVAKRSAQLKYEGSQEALQNPDFWQLKIKQIDQKLKEIDDQEGILDQQRDALAYERREHEKRFRAVEFNKVEEVYSSSSEDDEGPVLEEVSDDSSDIEVRSLQKALPSDDENSGRSY